jgi:(1->4)-alpha-D-glucan 1-alpha-D-glucosylmutase
MIRLSATARLQFHRGFTLDDARQVVPYLARLGISHLYASPLFTAVKGSTHGYDVVDPTEINPELGGRPALLSLVEVLRHHEMGLILDIVPNHMASSPENAWFMDVLQNGRTSRYANIFDIDWDSETPGLAGKMLLPILAEPYGQALESGNLKLHYDQDAVAFVLSYFDRQISIAPQSLAFVLHQGGLDDSADQPPACLPEAIATRIADAFDTSSATGRENMHQLLEMQHYRLAFWQNASDEINWRRFFEISDLIGVKVEREAVFDTTHQLVFELYRDGIIDGVRVDHIDGLAAPLQYCQRLRQRLLKLREQRPAELRQEPPFVWLEKILAEDEQLDPDWNTDGTTGYEFMNDVLRVLTDARGEAPLTQFWVTASNDEAPFDVYETKAREQILGEHLAGEFERLCARITDLSNMSLETRDITGVVIRRVMFALLIQFRVYRVYVQPGNASPADLAVLQHAADRARENLRPADHPALDAITAWLAGQAAGDDRQQRLLGVILTRFEQLSAPLAAKSVEDTAFYRYGRMLALNEVGGSPARFHLDASEFNQRMQERCATYPLALSPLATHDHKRGADARARLAVLSERADVFANLIRHVVVRLEELTAKQEVRISPVDLLMLLQTVVGAWPPALDVEDSAGIEEFVERLAGWQQKAVRESKLMSNWLLPNQDYEQAAHQVLDYLFNDDALRRPIYEAVQQIAAAGAANSLCQVLIQCIAPGIPDIYQGSETWDFSLVDPDNRRPVDFAGLNETLDVERPGEELLVHWRDGRVKQWLVARLLGWRRSHVDFLQRSQYLPLLQNDVGNSRYFAFARGLGNERVLAVMPRYLAHTFDAATLLPSSDAFADETFTPPEVAGISSYRNVLCGETYPANQPIKLAELFAHLPVALLQGVG